MVDKTFCKQALGFFLLFGAAGVTSFFVSKNIKRIRDEHRVRKVLVVTQILEDIEKEIKASQDEKKLRNFQALVKNIKDRRILELKE